MTDDNNDLMKRVVRVEGRVQGVGFRVNARRRAESLGVTAEPHNMDDGSVRIAVSGPMARLDEFLEWCREGPPSADVTSVSVENTEP